ncbi:MAG: outer membrane lipoprotein carrier protein LolA [Desulfobacteraceae bacterium]
MNRTEIVFAAVFTSVLFFVSMAGITHAEQSESLQDRVLTGLEKRFAGADFTAEFEQISRLKALEVDEEASGTAFFSHPGKMKWVYTSPTEHRIITNGETLWIHRPAENQVLKGGAEKYFKSGAGGAFLSDISLVREKYAIEIQENADEYFLLKLTPKVSTPEIDSVTVKVVKETFYIKEVVTTNAYGDTTELVFSDIQFKNLDSGMFDFEMPDNVDVIQMDQ